MFEAKNRLFECDYQTENMFEYVQCNDVQVGLISNFTIQFLDPTRFDVCLIEAKINVSVFDFTYLGK